MFPCGADAGLAGPGFGALLWLLLLATLAAGLLGGYLLVRLAADRPGEDTDAIAVLERRYARGEVDAEEFDARRDRPRENP